MWPQVIAGVIAVGATVLGSVIGNALSGMDRDKAAALIQASADEFGRIDLPKLKYLVAEQLPPSEYNKIKDDPDLKNAQVQALGKLKEVYQNGGATLDDRVAADQLTDRVNNQASAGFRRIQDDANARGTFGGGSQLAAQLAQGQAATQAAATGGAQLAAAQERRALDAMLQRGDMAGKIRSQDFDEQARVADANDMINRLNAQYRTQAAQYNNTLQQQAYDDQMRKTEAKYGVAKEQAGMAMNNANRTQQMWTGIGDATGRAVMGGVNAYAAGSGGGTSSTKQSIGSDPYSSSMGRPMADTAPVGGQQQPSYSQEYGDLTDYNQAGDYGGTGEYGFRRGRGLGSYS